VCARVALRVLIAGAFVLEPDAGGEARRIAWGKIAAARAGGCGSRWRGAGKGPRFGAPRRGRAACRTGVGTALDRGSGAGSGRRRRLEPAARFGWRREQRTMGQGYGGPGPGLRPAGAGLLAGAANEERAQGAGRHPMAGTARTESSSTAGAG